MSKENKNDLEILRDKIESLVKIEGYKIEEINLIPSVNHKINSESWIGETIEGEIKLKVVKMTGLMAYSEEVQNATDK